MKTNAIVRIVIYSLVIVLLLGILVIGIGAGRYMFQGNSGSAYVTSSGSINAGEVQKLHIEWACGAVNVVPGDTDEITFAEEGQETEGRPMVYELHNGTLTIHYAETDTFSIGFTAIEKKNLTITVPRDWECRSLRIDSASTDLNIQDLTIDSLELNCASGDCVLTNCNVGCIDLDGASCDMNFSGTLRELDCDGASMKLTAVFRNTPDSIDFDGASASVDITLPKDCGFQLELDGMSNSFTSDFSTKSSNGRYTYGDGHCRINVDGMSATVVIRSSGSPSENSTQ